AIRSDACLYSFSLFTLFFIFVISFIFLLSSELFFPFVVYRFDFTFLSEVCTSFWWCHQQLR
ncbi:hypothetical protein CSUI_005706, partial [Cystoisospora suis]